MNVTSDMRKYSASFLLIFSLWSFDQWLTDDRSIGWERNSVRNSLDRWENTNRAKVAILGSSTSKDWMSLSELETLLGMKRGSVVDAHINGCHQGCTWASIRRMLQRVRIKRCRFRGANRCIPNSAPRFEHVFFGTNLFQMCEDGHSKRVLQHQMLLPTQDIPRLFTLYLSAQNPLRRIGRFLGGGFWGGYGDPRAVQDYWRSRWIGSGRRGYEHRWYRSKAVPLHKETLSCDYQPQHVALKLAFMEAILDDLQYLSKQTYVMLLPDQSRFFKEALHQNRWALHYQAYQRLSQERSWVHLIDLTQGGIQNPAQFRDGFHLKREFFPLQRALFKKKLSEILTQIKNRTQEIKRKEGQ